MSAQTATNEQTARPATAKKMGRPKGSGNISPTVKVCRAAVELLNSKVPDEWTVDNVQAIEMPKLRLLALGRSTKALDLLYAFVIGVEEGGKEAPASIRRLAALDILNIAGLTTTSQTIVKQTATNKPVAELDADELRALLASQKSALEQINHGLGRVVNDADG
jgi:hypothetical protein